MTLSRAASPRLRPSRPSKKKAAGWHSWWCSWIGKKEAERRSKRWGIRSLRYSNVASCSKTMPDHINERIARLRERVQQGLFEANLDKLVQECNSLLRTALTSCFSSRSRTSSENFPKH